MLEPVLKLSEIGGTARWWTTQAAARSTAHLSQQRLRRRRRRGLARRVAPAVAVGLLAQLRARNTTREEAWSKHEVPRRLLCTVGGRAPCRLPSPPTCHTEMKTQQTSQHSSHLRDDELLPRARVPKRLRVALKLAALQGQACRRLGAPGAGESTAEVPAAGGRCICMACRPQRSPRPAAARTGAGAAATRPRAGAARPRAGWLAGALHS